MARLGLVAAGLAAYAIFMATFVYMIGFVAALPMLPATVDSGAPSSLALALPIDLALISLFGLQHSLMARAGFKAAWTRIIPKAIERSVYVLCTSLVLIVLFVFWRPLPSPIWTVTGPLATLLWSLCALGWFTVVFSTFLLNHFELFGLQQVYFNLRRRFAAPPVFQTVFLYKFVRHPLYTGFILALWSTPRLTAGHALLAAGMTGYILIALRYEERDLVTAFGRDYELYRQNVGMLTPRLRRRA